MNPISVDNVIKLSDVASRNGTAIVLSAVAILVFGSVMITVLFMFKAMFKKLLDNNTNKEVVETLKGLNSSVKEFSQRLDEMTIALNMDNKIFDRLAVLETKVTNYDTAVRKNLITFIRHIFNGIDIDNMCMNNTLHRKEDCPNPNSIFCNVLEELRLQLKEQIEKYIIDESISTRILNLIETRVVPNKHIQLYLQELLKELEEIIKHG